jgi:hypothetical protein
MRERESFGTHLFQDTSLPHLVSFFLVFSIPALLVGRGVTTQAPSSNNNNNTYNNTNNNNTSSNNTNKINSRTQSQKKFAALNNRQEFF